MEKVQVLLSSYNGQKYIGQQLDSIFNQEGVEVHCLVRDDGSTDDTLKMIFEYQIKYDNLEVIQGENIGYKKSFMKLVEKSGEYDYYAFADQDDLWSPIKMIKAVEQINEIEGNIPVMYCSNCTLVDSELNYIGMLYSEENIVPKSNVTALVQGFAYGCTMVFNCNARNVIQKYTPKNEYAHDFWIPIILKFIGEIIYDKNSYILYRQHDKNVLGSKRSNIKIFKIKMKIFRNKYFYSKLTNEILRGYSELLKYEDYSMLKNISKYRTSFLRKVNLLLNNQLKRSTLKGTIFLKILILFSRF